MFVRDELKALRGDDREARTHRVAMEEALEDCRREPRLAAVLEELLRYGEGGDFAHCPALVALFEHTRAARDILRPLIGRLIALHRAYPLAQLAFRHRSQSGTHVLQIAARGHATLSLVLQDAAAFSELPIATFVDAEQREMVLAGKASACLFAIEAEDRGRVTLNSVRTELQSGARMKCTGPRQSRLIQPSHDSLLTLRLARTAGSPGPTRRVDVRSGRIVHRASGNAADSRAELAMLLLGRMGRSDAFTVLAARTRTGDAQLRWQALRQCLALDAATGLPLLERIAKDHADPLCQAARALLAQLQYERPSLLSEPG